MHKVMKPDAEWLAQLGELAFQVTRRAATERPFSHPGFPKGPGTYRCVCCDAPLFDASTKFESGCGWPSFNAALPNDMVEEHEDRSHYMVRTEVTCARCAAWSTRNAPSRAVRISASSFSGKPAEKGDAV